jgi:hypothetical protein
MNIFTFVKRAATNPDYSEMLSEQFLHFNVIKVYEKYQEKITCC